MDESENALQELNNSMLHEEAGSDFYLEETWRAGFFQLLQVVRCFASKPGNPAVAAYLSHLFLGLRLRDPLTELHSWLYEFISAFIENPPREETDLPDKTLAIATYVFISETANLRSQFTRQELEAYIDYAAQQDWLQNPRLAYFCNSLTNSIPSCATTVPYFDSSFEYFISRKHIPSICQALAVLKGNLERVELEHASSVVLEKLGASHNPSVRNLSWVLLAHARNGRLERAKVEQIAQLIDQYFSNVLVALGGESSFIASLAAVIDDSTDDAFLPDPTSKVGDEDNAKASSTKKQRHDTVQVTTDPISLADIGLALFAVFAVGKHKIVGVQEQDRIRLLSAIKHVQTLRKGGTILNSIENVLTSISVISLTFTAGALLIYFFLGGAASITLIGNRVSVVLDSSQLSWRNWEVFVFGAVWLDTLIAQIQAVRRSEPAIRALGRHQLPVLRHVFTVSSKLRSSWQKEPYAGEHSR